MAKQLFVNNAATTLNGSLPNAGTTLVLYAGAGSKFPTPTGGDYFYLTLYEKDLSNNEVNFEVVKVTARTYDTCTIVRDVESMVSGQGGPSSGGFGYPTVVGRTVYASLRWTAGAVGHLLQTGDIGSTVQAWYTDLDWLAANISTAGKALLDDANAAAQRTTLGLGTAATVNVPASGNAASGEVVKGSDTRLSDARTPTTHSHVVADTTGLQTALDAKQATLVSGTNIKTINSSSVLGSGDLAVQAVLVSGTNIKTVGGTNLLGSGNVAVATSSGSDVQKGDGSGGLTAATAGTDYVAPGTATSFTKPQRPSLSSETTPSSNTVTWDLTSDQIFRINLNASITTFSLTGTLSSLAGNQYQAVVRFNGGSAITWPASVKWPAGTAPTLTGTSGKVDIFNFVVSSTDGTNYYLLNTGKTQNLG